MRTGLAATAWVTLAFGELACGPQGDAASPELDGSVPADAGSMETGSIDAAIDAGQRDAPVFGLDGRPRNATCRAPASAAEMPARLSETGCFDRVDPHRPAEGLIPYGVNAPLWSDGAAKERYVALPDDGKVVILPDGDLDFPTGTVLVKTFSIRGAAVETRLFLRHPTGQWAGYSYAWDASASDATLVGVDGEYQPIGDQEWHFPGRQHCLDCHTQAAGWSLGLELGQLDGLFTYPNGRTAQQLATWNAIGLFESADATTSATPLPAPTDESLPVAARARSYLHANCANCHRPSGVRDPAVAMDLRFSVPLAGTGTCDEPPHKADLGIEGVRILAPGVPAKSLISVRMHSEVPSLRMPPVASALVDEQGTGLVDAWIVALGPCL